MEPSSDRQGGDAVLGPSGFGAALDILCPIVPQLLLETGLGSLAEASVSRNRCTPTPCWGLGLGQDIQAHLEKGSRQVEDDPRMLAHAQK